VRRKKRKPRLVPTPEQARRVMRTARSRERKKLKRLLTLATETTVIRKVTMGPATATVKLTIPRTWRRMLRKQGRGTMDLLKPVLEKLEAEMTLLALAAPTEPPVDPEASMREKLAKSIALHMDAAMLRALPKRR
jgi:hypothetical protein